MLDQEKLMRQLSEFLGVNYSLKMLSFNGDFKNQLTDVEIEKNIHKSIADTPGDNHVSRWKKDDVNDNFYYLEKVCQTNLQALGYELSNSVVELERPDFIRKIQIQIYKILIFIYSIYHKQLSRRFAQSIKASSFFQKIRDYIRSK